jgi:hypothetical protein
VRVVSTKLRISSIYYGVASGGMFRCMAVISCQRTLSGHVCHLHLFKVYQSLSLAFSGSATSHGSILCFSGLSTLFSRTQSLSDQYIILGDIPHFLKHHTLYACNHYCSRSITFLQSYICGSVNRRVIIGIATRHTQTAGNQVLGDS